MSHKLWQLCPNKLNGIFRKLGQETAEHQHRKNTFMFMKRFENTIVLSQTNPTKVYETITRLNNRRSAVMFEFTNVILKTVDNTICGIFCDVFNKKIYFHAIY